MYEYGAVVQDNRGPGRRARGRAALALYERDQVDEAIAAFRRAVDLYSSDDNPRKAEALTNLGLALRDKGRLDEAIAHLQEAIRLDPKGSALAHCPRLM